MRHKVEVEGQPFEIDVDRRSNWVWIASGVYHGKRFEVKGPSENSVVRAWKDVATYRGN